MEWKTIEKHLTKLLNKDMMFEINKHLSPADKNWTFIVINEAFVKNIVMHLNGHSVVKFAINNVEGQIKNNYTLLEEDDPNRWNHERVSYYANILNFFRALTSSPKSDAYKLVETAMMERVLQFKKECKYYFSQTINKHVIDIYPGLQIIINCEVDTITINVFFGNWTYNIFNGNPIITKKFKRKEIPIPPKAPTEMQLKNYKFKNTIRIFKNT